MIIVNGILNLGRCDQASVQAILADHIATLRAQPGCEHASLSLDCSDPARLHLFERWANPETFMANGRGAHQRLFSDALDRLGIVIVDLQAWAADHWIDLLKPPPPARRP